MISLQRKFFDLNTKQRNISVTIAALNLYGRGDFYIIAGSYTEETILNA
jgi:hypothetical protein